MRSERPPSRESFDPQCLTDLETSTHSRSPSSYGTPSLCDVSIPWLAIAERVPSRAAEADLMGNAVQSPMLASANSSSTTSSFAQAVTTAIFAGWGGPRPHALAHAQLPPRAASAADDYEGVEELLMATQSEPTLSLAARPSAMAVAPHSFDSQRTLSLSSGGGSGSLSGSPAPPFAVGLDYTRAYVTTATDTPKDGEDVFEVVVGSLPTVSMSSDELTPVVIRRPNTTDDTTNGSDDFNVSQKNIYTATYTNITEPTATVDATRTTTSVTAAVAEADPPCAGIAGRAMPESILVNQARTARTRTDGTHVPRLSSALLQSAHTAVNDRQQRQVLVLVDDDEASTLGSFTPSNSTEATQRWALARPSSAAQPLLMSGRTRAALRCPPSQQPSLFENQQQQLAQPRHRSARRSFTSATRTTDGGRAVLRRGPRAGLPLSLLPTHSQPASIRVRGRSPPTTDEVSVDSAEENEEALRLLQLEPYLQNVLGEKADHAGSSATSGSRFSPDAGMQAVPVAPPAPTRSNSSGDAPAALVASWTVRNGQWTFEPGKPPTHRCYPVVSPEVSTSAGLTPSSSSQQGTGMQSSDANGAQPSSQEVGVQYYYDIFLAVNEREEARTAASAGGVDQNNGSRRQPPPLFPEALLAPPQPPRLQRFPIYASNPALLATNKRQEDVQPPPRATSAASSDGSVSCIHIPMPPQIAQRISHSPSLQSTIRSGPVSLSSQQTQSQLTQTSQSTWRTDCSNTARDGMTASQQAQSHPLTAVTTATAAAAHSTKSFSPAVNGDAAVAAAGTVRAVKLAPPPECSYEYIVAEAVSKGNMTPTAAAVALSAYRRQTTVPSEQPHREDEEEGAVLPPVVIIQARQPVWASATTLASSALYTQAPLSAAPSADDGDTRKHSPILPHCTSPAWETISRRANSWNEGTTTTTTTNATTTATTATLQPLVRKTVEPARASPAASASQGSELSIPLLRCSINEFGELTPTSLRNLNLRRSWRQEGKLDRWREWKDT